MTIQPLLQGEAMQGTTYLNSMITNMVAAFTVVLGRFSVCGNDECEPSLPRERQIF